MRKLGKQLLNFDVFERQYSFELNKQQHFKTVAGTLFTFLIIATTSVLSFLFGQEIFLRRNPVVNMSQEHIDSFNLYLSQIPFFFSFHWNNGSFIEDINKILTTNVKLFEFNAFNNTVKQFPGLTLCNHELYGLNNSLMMEALSSRKPFYCISQSDQLYFNNKYGAVNSAFVHIEFEQCIPNGSEECSEKLKELTNELYVRTLFLNSYVNPTNYDEPVIYYLDSLTQQVGNSLLKRTYFEYVNNKIETDQGWVLEDKQNIDYIKMTSISQDINPEVNTKLYWISIVSSDLRNKTVRSYMKIQDLLAKVGGFSNGLYLVILIFMSDYVKFRYYLLISLQSFNSESLSPDSIRANFKPVVPELHDIKKLTQLNSSVEIVKANQIFILQKTNELKTVKPENLKELPYLEYIFFKCFMSKKQVFFYYTNLINSGKLRMSLENLWQPNSSLSSLSKQFVEV